MNILAVGCHPDDLEIGCYGTLAKYVQMGHQVSVCHVANGNLGHVEILQDELAKIRFAEAEEAASIIQVETETLPIRENQKAYQDAYSLYCELYGALKPVYDKGAALAL